MIRIVTDSVCDLPKEFVKENNITVLPLTIILGEKTYKDGINIFFDDIVNAIERDGIFPSTSQVNPHEFMEVFEKLTENGDEVIAILMSSKLSGTFNSANIAAGMLEDRKIKVIDSEGATLGYGLIVAEAIKMVKENKSYNEIIDRIEYLKKNMEYVLMVDTLEYLHKGGRIGSAQYFLGNMLNLKIILSIKNGEIVVKEKIRGQKKAINWMLDYINKHNLTGKTIGINYSKDTEIYEILKEKVQENSNIQEIISSRIGSTVASYAGTNAVGIYFER